VRIRGLPAVAAIVFASLTTIAQPAAATTEASMQTCGSGILCAYPQTNYTGRAVTLTAVGGCTTFRNVGYRRSNINDSNFEGYFYSNDNCTGSTKPVTYYSRSPNIGFAAGSFLQACVSCRSEDQ
jgi:hypothetical protein